MPTPHASDETLSPELSRLGRTLGRWRTQIVNWHRSQVTNGPTEAANNLAKLVKRTSLGITNFDHCRIRVLLYAGKPDWTLLDDLTPRQNAKSPVRPPWWFRGSLDLAPCAVIQVLRGSEG